MNKKLFYGAFAFAALGLASCSSEEPVNNGSNNNQTIEGEGYIAVNIKTAGTGSTRAITNTAAEYEPGSDAENLVKYSDVRFYFYDVDGKAFVMTVNNNINGTVSSNAITPVETLQTGTTNGNDVSGKAVLVLGKKAEEGFEADGEMPYQAICVANLTSDQFEQLENKDLSVVAETINVFAEENADDPYTPYAFVMSNSNYDGAEEYGANLLTGHIFTTPEQAIAAPVNFFIERLAAKVRIKDGSLKGWVSQVKEGETVKNALYTIYDVNGAKREVNLQVNLTDWVLLNRAPKSYLIKKLPTTEPFADWSNAEYHRSFWAVNPADLETEENTFDILSNTNWSKADKYCYEFTSGTANSVTDRYATTTAMAIRGYVQEKNADGEWQNIDLCRWGGAYYDLNALKALIANAIDDVDADDVEFILAEGTNTYKAYVEDNSVTSVDEDDANGIVGKRFLGFQNIQWWNNGATSFYLNIEQAKNGTTPVFGVVRNHIYEYTFDNVVGLGYPGNEPVQPEDDDTFVAATINILNWAVVKNTVTLE